MFNYILSPNATKKNEIKMAHYAFFSFKAIAECNSKLTEIIIEDKRCMKKLFSLINNNR